MSPMLTEDVRNVGSTRNEVEPDDARGNGFTYTVKGYDRVSLVKLGMYFHGAVDNGLVVTKHERLLS